jgi:flagellar M-ring protein FliF
MAENSFVQTIKGLGTTRLAVMGGILALLVVFFLFVSLRVSEPTMSILYSDLTTIDSSAVSGKLAEEAIVFQVSPDGSRVFVPEQDVGRARMLLAQAGLPNGGSLGYELFDQQSGFGTTTFVQNLNSKRALEGELSRTIMALEQVESAKVHIVLPQRDLFAREARQATASVTLKLKPTERLDKKQIYGIQNLVASAVPELSTNSVSIVDSQANLLAGGDNDEDALGGGNKAEEMRRGVETRFKGSIEDVVGRVVGLDNVRATVSANLDFDRISTNSETYDPEGQVLRSSQVTEENATERSPQNEGVTVANNLPGVDALDGPSDSPTAENSRIEELSNYEISRTVSSTVRETGQITKLSVAVVVDGSYVTDAEGNKVYQERSTEQMEAIKTIVRSAIGFDESRGDTLEVVNLPFTDIEFEVAEPESTILGFSKDNILETFQMLTLGVMLILVILLVVKPILSQLFQSVQKDEPQEDDVAALLEGRHETQALAGPSGGGADGEDDDELMIDMGAVEGKVKASTVKKVGEIVENHPTETVAVMRQWMSSD